MNWKLNYDKWNDFVDLDHELKAELTNIMDESQLEDRFYKNLEFGTGGMRGEIGVGTNRLNLYTIRKATQGLADYIKENGATAMAKGVVIAYDSRHKSPEFALETAKVLIANGVKTYLFESLRATPELSFALRHLGTFSGIVLTASHNPSEYNGYKVYGEDGGQIPPVAADKLVSYVNAVADELKVATADLDTDVANDLLVMVGKDIDDAYLENLTKISLQPQLLLEAGKDLSIVFTPLHGTSRVMVTRGLAELGFNNVTIVKEQEMPDPNFTTVASPNPEEHDAFEYAIKYGNDVNADILLATDPDSDRLGIAVKNPAGEYVVLTGNQTGALMLEYLLSQKSSMGKLPVNGIILKTIVTSEIGRVIGKAYGIKTLDTLTGFKFIGKKIEEFNNSGEYKFQFGYEESYGYLINDFVRDKDAIQATIFACEVALHHKKQGRTMYEALMQLFEKYGYFYEDLHSLTLKGISGIVQIEQIMNYFRNMNFIIFAGIEIIAIEDYQTSIRKVIKTDNESTINLPKSNVLKYHFANGSWFCLRPSGTEPKIKLYFGTKGTSTTDALANIDLMKRELLTIVNRVIEV